MDEMLGKQHLKVLLSTHPHEYSPDFHSDSLGVDLSHA